MYCGSCGNPIEKTEQVCSKCGSRQNKTHSRPEVQYAEEQERLLCPECGRETKETTKFCPGCGTVLPGVKMKKIPLCVLCGAKLEEGSRSCKQCNTAYKEAEDGYITLTETFCGSCGASTVGSEAFCCECGASLAKSLVEKQKKLLPVCKNCGRELDLNGSFCTNCGEVTTISKVKPVLKNGRLTCPACGETGMLPNRKICFRCGVEFLPTPWVCEECGKTNYYSSGVCVYCHPEEAQQKTTAKSPAAGTAGQKPFVTIDGSPLPKPKKEKTYLPSDFPMKWYYFLIYVVLIGGAVGGFISGLVSFTEGRVFMGIAFLLVGIDALVTRSALANFHSSGPSHLTGYLLFSYGLNFIDTLIKYNNLSSYAAEIEGTTYLLTMVFGIIALLIQVFCNISYFNNRRVLFVN